MKPALLRLAGPVLLAGGALAGAATGGYALGAASPISRVRSVEPARTARSDEAADVLRRIEARLARLEARGAEASPRLAQAAAGTTPDPDLEGEPLAVAEIEGAEETGAAAAGSDPDVLVASQRLIDDVLAARGMTEASKAALRETLPKLSPDDRMAAMNELGVALNKGEIEFDAREIF